jgi:MFS family permease
LLRLALSAGAGDALVAVALANTVFFHVPVGEARERVALYLLLTMAPFAVVAPVVGPLLDRARSGRRYALAVTMAARAVLAWSMAQAPNGLRIYPAAFAVLVLAKAYGVARSAAVPRLLPDDATLVGTNARLSAATIAASTTAALLGLGLGRVAGYEWTLRLAALAFAAGTMLALVLPRQVDSPPGDPAKRERLKPPAFPREVRTALLSAVSLRALAGFLTTYLAFLLRRKGSDLDVGLLAASVAVGSAAGTGLGAGLRNAAPDRLVVVAVGLGAAFCAVGSWRYSLATALLAALAAAVAGALAKIALDATVQVGFADAVRGQAFARSETLLQLAWVAGGAVGLALPLRGSYGLGLAAVALVAATGWVRIRAAR